MRGTRRFTLVPSLSVVTSSETGTGLSETVYFGLAIGKCRVYQDVPLCRRVVPSRHRVAGCGCVTLKLPRVPARVIEAIVLRTYPLKDADLVVSFLTRDQGKLRGVAKRARRPKNAFGSGLERLSQVRMSYFQRENRELVNLDSCELIRSQFGLLSDYSAGVALDYLAEVSEQLLPSAEPSEKFFRL